MRSKKQATPDWQVVVLISKGTYTELVLAIARQSRPPYPPGRILKVGIEPLTGFSHIFSPVAAPIHCSLKAVGAANRRYIPRTREEGGTYHCQIAPLGSCVNRQSCPLDDLLQHALCKEFNLNP